MKNGTEKTNSATTITSKKTNSNKGKKATDKTKKTVTAKKSVAVAKNSAKNKKNVSKKTATSKKTVAARTENKRKANTFVVQNGADIKEAGIWRNFWKCLKKYFVFSGRASRYEYFAFNMTYFFITIALSFLGIFFSLFYHLGILCTLLFIIPSLSVLSRRLHDIGKNLWNGLFNWVVYGAVAGLIVGGGVFFFTHVQAKLAFLVSLPYFLLTLVIFSICAAIRWLIYVCRRGNQETNKYGDVPALNNPKSEKTAFWMIICYFSLNVFCAIVGIVMEYTYKEGLRQNALQTEKEFIAVQQAINDVYARENSYVWLNNQTVLDLRLVPPEMHVLDGMGIISAFGLPVSFYGFLESYIIVVDGIDRDICHTILKTPWRLQKLHTIQIRQNQGRAVALTNSSQCYPCDKGGCEIAWILQ